jgi:OmcA/MtrC family decaheme c-type cytochrome
MTHAIHASGIRTAPHGSYDEARLQYPGDLSDCASCHTGGSQLLPLPLQRQAIRTTSGPAYTTPIAALCSGCHDDAVAKGHMESAGGAIFDSDFDTANVAESCNVCHASGKDADVDKVHNK